MSNARERLPELKARQYERLNWRTMIAPTAALTLAHVTTMDRYFRRFVQADDSKCICCGTEQGGFASAILGTGFTWGLAHGEGRCNTCGYPARALHYDVGPIKRAEMILQYHPDDLVPS